MRCSPTYRSLPPGASAASSRLLRNERLISVTCSEVHDGWPMRCSSGTQPLLVAYTVINALGSFDRGGRALATVFDGGDDDKIALLWREAWDRADPDNMRAAIRLARERDVSDDPLADLAANVNIRAKAKLSDCASVRDHERPASPDVRAGVRLRLLLDDRDRSTTSIPPRRRFVCEMIRRRPARQFSANPALYDQPLTSSVNGSVGHPYRQPICTVPNRAGSLAAG
jgi:hypothetical protein